MMDNSCPTPTPTPEKPTATLPDSGPNPMLPRDVLGDDSARGAELLACFEDDHDLRVLDGSKTVSDNMSAEVRQK